MMTDLDYKILEAYNAKRNVSQVARDLKLTQRFIKSTLIKNKVDRVRFPKRNKKYSIDENCFETIDTPEKAYWLGFIAADGYIFSEKKENRERHGLTITIAAKDVELLISFSKFLKSDVPIRRFFKTLETSDKLFEFVSLTIYNSILSQQLISHGLIQNKSLVLQPPKLDDLLKEFYILGYFDGDGCISVYTERKILKSGVSFTGTKEVCFWIRDFFKREGCHFSFYNRTPDKNTWGLMSSGNNKTYLIYKILYNRCKEVPFLKRKFDRFKIIEEKVKKTKPVGFYIKRQGKSSWKFDFRFQGKRITKYGFKSIKEARESCLFEMNLVGYMLGIKKLSSF